MVRVFKFAVLSSQLACITRWQISDGPEFTDQTLKSCMRFAHVLSDGLGRTNARLSVKTGPTWERSVGVWVCEARFSEGKQCLYWVLVGVYTARLCKLAKC